MSVFCHVSNCAATFILVGQIRAQRDGWIAKAREHLRSGHSRELVEQCARFARKRNREMLNALADARAIEATAKPARRRQRSRP